MSDKPASPIRPTDDAARDLARRLVEGAETGALGVLDPAGGGPVVSRIAVSPDPSGGVVTLISDLSQHTAALRADPACSVLLGEPGRGDPLAHPRLSLQARALFTDRDDPDHAARRAAWLARHPKAQLYIDFGDFRFVRLIPTGAYLNGGFGKAFVLSPGDLAGSDR